jgi:hypothetical protein
MYRCKTLPVSICNWRKNTAVRKNPPVDTSKANSWSQKAAPINAWLLAQGSYKRQKALLIRTSTSQAAAITVGIQNKHASLSWKALKPPHAQ